MYVLELCVPVLACTRYMFCSISDVGRGTELLGAEPHKRYGATPTAGLHCGVQLLNFEG